MVGLNSCGRDLWSGDGNQVARESREECWIWKGSREEIAEGRKGKSKIGWNQKLVNSAEKVLLNDRKSVCSILRVLSLEWLERFCRIWWALVGRGNCSQVLLLSSLELSSSPARSAEPAGLGRGLAAAPATGPPSLRETPGDHPMADGLAR